MSNYTVTTNFGAKDSLSSGDAAKLIKGSEFTTEFTNIATAVATKADTASPTFSGTVTIPTATITTANISGGAIVATSLDLEDSNKIKLGTGDDLEIYHDGTHSYVADVGTGDLILTGNNNLILKKETTGETYINCIADGAVEVKYNNSTKFATTSSGVDVTGTLVADDFEVERADDGTVASFKRDGSVIGRVRVASSGSGSVFTIGNADVALGFVDGAGVNYIAPYNIVSGAVVDDSVDLGIASARFDDIFATNGTIQTSDQNDKQDIAELTEAEERVAVACKGLIRKFKWRNSVEEKGNNARYHFGVIAQDVQAAFAAEGLDAGDYGLFISSTWTDDDGVEQTRLGVRYSELLAFIIGGL